MINRSEKGSDPRATLITQQRAAAESARRWARRLALKKWSEE